jgi:hypothetical protein
MNEHRVLTFPEFVSMLANDLKITGTRQTPKGGQVITFGPRPGKNPSQVPRSYEVEIGSLENPVTFPFGLSIPYSPGNQEKVFGLNDPINLDVQIPLKEEPMSRFCQSCRELDDAMLKLLMEEWETIDGSKPERAIVERQYKKITVNYPPNDPMKKKQFDPLKYNPAIRLKFVRANMEERCFRIHDTWQPTEPSLRVAQKSWQDIKPFDTGIVKATFSGLWLMNGAMGPLFYTSSIILNKTKAIDPLELSTGNVVVDNSPSFHSYEDHGQQAIALGAEVPHSSKEAGSEQEAVGQQDDSAHGVYQDAPSGVTTGGQQQKAAKAGQGAQPGEFSQGMHDDRGGTSDLPGEKTLGNNADATAYSLSKSNRSGDSRPTNEVNEDEEESEDLSDYEREYRSKQAKSSPTPSAPSTVKATPKEDLAPNQKQKPVASKTGVANGTKPGLPPSGSKPGTSAKPTPAASGTHMSASDAQKRKREPAIASEIETLRAAKQGKGS